MFLSPLYARLPLPVHTAHIFPAPTFVVIITPTQEAMDYLTWTYFYRRLVMNPTYYNLEDSSPDGINLYLSELVRFRRVGGVRSSRHALPSEHTAHLSAASSG